MIGQRTKLCVIAFLILQLASACVLAPTSPPTPPPSPTPDLVDLVMAFQDALNRGSIDEAAALFHDDSVGLIIQDVLPGPTLTSLRDNLEFAVAQGLKLALTGCKLEGNAVNCQMVLQDNVCIKTLVQGPLHATAIFRFLDGKINLVTSDPDPTENKKYWDTGSRFVEWSQLQRADEFTRANFPAATGTTPRQQAELFNKICADWAASHK
jgi:hypothetical protein